MRNRGNTSLICAYDAVNRVIRHTQQSGTRTTTLDYAYDALDRLTRRTLSSTDTNGATLPPDITRYAYDDNDRLITLTYEGGGTRQDVTRYVWNIDGRLTQKVLPNGITTSLQYDAAGQLTQLAYTDSQGAVLEQLDYRYNPTGQIIQRDSLHELHREETPYAAVYDAANRLTAITLQPGTPNQMRYQLRYDANGNLIEKQPSANPADITRYQWDSRHRLTGLTAPGMVAAFTYDAQNRRTSKTINGQQTTYLYDGLQAIGEIRPTANGNQISVNLTGLQIDEALARYTQQQQQGQNTVTSSTYLTDLLGSVIAQSNPDQRVQNRYGYSPYGDVATEGEDSQNPIQYTGRERDETGLYFYRNRYYDPVTGGRFISSDPIGLAGGLNTYAYVDNQPTMQTDPLGLMGSRGNPEVHSGSGQDGIGQTTGALGDFARNYQNMRDANTIGGDKYFHCMANCQAARQGSIGFELSRAISEARELTDEYIKGDSAQACNDDGNANNAGRNGGNNNPGLPCSSVCGGYRPNGLPSKY